LALVARGEATIYRMVTGLSFFHLSLSFFLLKIAG
jgi:hypothetical protein